MRMLLTTLLLFLIWPVQAQMTISRTADKADGSGSYAGVNPGDTVYLESGSRAQLIIENFSGTATKPIIFIPENPDNPVVVRTSATYGISIRNCHFIRISGVKKYGIRILELGQEGENSVGVSMHDKSSDVEIDHIEIANASFAGIVAKTDPVCEDPGTQRGAFVQRNTRIHHCYIHDTWGEGMYVGNTFFHGIQKDCGIIFPTYLEGVEVHHNRIERTGWDGIQISSVISGCKIYNNELNDVSFRMTPSQMSGILIGGGTKADCYNNRIKDCYATAILVFGNGGTRIFNNVIIRPGLRYEPEDPLKREHGIFIEDKTKTDKTFYGIYSNTIVQPKTDAIRISVDQDFEVRLYNNLLVDPGAREYYDSDNTDRTGEDAFIFVGNPQTPVAIEGNALLPLISLAQFSSEAGDNFHLQPSSTLIDTGRDLSDQSGLSFDLDGNTRPLRFGWDIGAYEYNSLAVSRFISPGQMPVSQVYLAHPSGRPEIRMSFTGQTAFRFRILSLTGAVLDQGAFDYGQATAFSHPVHPSIKGLIVVQLFGADWQFSEKLLVN